MQVFLGAGNSQGAKLGRSLVWSTTLPQPIPKSFNAYWWALRVALPAIAILLVLTKGVHLPFKHSQPTNLDINSKVSDIPNLDNMRVKAMNLSLRQSELQNSLAQLGNAKLVRTSSESQQIRDALRKANAAENEVEGLQVDIYQLNQLLGDDPAKKMSVVLLRRDLDSMQANVKESFGKLEDTVKSDFGLLEWAVILLGVSNFAGPLMAHFLQKRQGATP